MQCNKQYICFCSWKLHFTALNLSIKIWQDATYEIHCMKQKYENLNSMKSHLHYNRTTYYRCSYVVSSIHEYFAVTDSHLQISQHQASLKHENSTESITATPHYYHKTFCSYSYILVVHLQQGCQTRFSSEATSSIFNLKRAGPM